MIQAFNKDNFYLLCDKLAKKDKDLSAILNNHGYPPFWSRVPSFATLIHIILEQQVSLASAKAAFIKLQEKADTITPQTILSLNDEDLKKCYFTRQKIKYARHVAISILNGALLLDKLGELTDTEIRFELKKIKGIGDWSVDVYLMMALNRSDCFPTGDIALMKSIKEVKGISPLTSRAEINLIAEQWKPYRTIAAYILWHAYLRKKRITV